MSAKSTPHSVSCKCCNCVPSTSSDSVVDVNCICPRDEHDIVQHTETCLLYKNEQIIFPHEPESCECVDPPFESGLCECCACLPDECRCKKAGRDTFDEWRSKRNLTDAFPSVMESSNPLMQKFQETLKKFLEKENALALEQILDLRDELKNAKEKYNADLEVIYKTDHDTNSQRQMIEEYESTLSKYAAEREEAEQTAKKANEEYKKAKEKLDNDINAEREANEEIEALTMLCNQLNKWREETESELTVSKTMTDKMKKEKQAVAEEKRKLDMIVLWLNQENWKLESKIEMYKKQMEIKSAELELVTDKVTAYSVELDDLELDRKRLFVLWNSVIVNIKQRDKVYDTVRDDYRYLQENYSTLNNNLDVTKKVVEDEMNTGKALMMNKDKIEYDLTQVDKLYEEEETLRIEIETDIAEIQEEVEMCDREERMIKMENQAMQNILNSTIKELEKKTAQKQKIENEIISNLNDCLLNDKAVQAMASGLFKMRDMNRKLEVALQELEYQHAKVMLDIELTKSRQKQKQSMADRNAKKIKAKEKAITDLEEEQSKMQLKISAKQREWYLISKRFKTLKEFFDGKSPQEIRIVELESQIRNLRNRTEEMQQGWLRLQGHVVNLTAQYHKVTNDINLNNNQIQICEQKILRIAAECEKIRQDRSHVERTLRDLRGRLELLERTRYEANYRNQDAERATLAVTHEYVANLKDAETELMQIEEDIENMEKQKMNLCQELDRMQKEALIWQRKGILAVELKRNIKNAQSAAGEIGRMKTEIHRMSVRRAQLMKVCDRLSEDLVQCVRQREIALDRARVTAAVEAAHSAPPGQMAHAQYQHKLRLAKADLGRVTKDVNDTKSTLEGLEKERDKLETEIADLKRRNSTLEEEVASILRKCREAEREKHWLLERVVRCQRLGTELATAVKRQTMRVKKPPQSVIDDYNIRKGLNERLKFIVDTLLKEYPHLEHKLLMMNNTLTIDSPRTYPRLLDASCCCKIRAEMGQCDCEPICPGPDEPAVREVCECEECPELPVTPEEHGCLCDETNCPQPAERPLTP